jgi:hypothetical protein
MQNPWQRRSVPLLGMRNLGGDYIPVKSNAGAAYACLKLD